MDEEHVRLPGNGRFNDRRRDIHRQRNALHLLLLRLHLQALWTIITNFSKAQIVIQIMNQLRF